MSIRFPVELAAAAEYAERAIDTAPVRSDMDQAAVFGSWSFDLGLAGEPITLSLGPGFVAAGTARKLIPGQTYH